MGSFVQDGACRDTVAVVWIPCILLFSTVWVDVYRVGDRDTHRFSLKDA